MKKDWEKKVWKPTPGTEKQNSSQDPTISAAFQ